MMQKKEIEKEKMLSKWKQRRKLMLLVMLPKRLN
jgi:hypothetical protein